MKKFKAMSFSPALYAYQAFDASHFSRRERPRNAPGSKPPRAQSRAGHPVLFMGGFLLVTSLAVIGLWQGLGLLLPH
jgi:hypothetical protein